MRGKLLILIDIQTGSHSLDVANLTGMISLASPAPIHRFDRVGSAIVYPRYASFYVDRVTINSLPEPSQLALITCGTMALGVLYSRRSKK